jgi:peptide subunit release factor 1 (eRF1)
MRHRGVTPAGGVDASDLRSVVDAKGPFATVLLDTDPAVPNARYHLEQKWSNVRRELTAAGAPEATLAGLEEQVSDAHLSGHAFYAVADGERVRLVAHWPDRPAYELTRWAPLPTFTPLLERRQVEIRHVVVLVDREGADLVTVTPATTSNETIEGESGPVIHRSAPGGWSQMRYQHRAEVAWARTAREIAGALTDEFDAAHAELVVIAGDVREVQLVTDDLPKRVRDRLHVVTGGRAPGTDEDAMQHEITRLVLTAAAEASVALLRKLREEAGQGDRAVVGAEATFDALRKAQVDVLLVHDDQVDHRSAWFGLTPLLVGLIPDEASVDRSEVQLGRLVDVAVRAAIDADAGIRVIPSVSAVADGIAAILRWSD